MRVSGVVSDVVEVRTAGMGGHDEATPQHVARNVRDPGRARNLFDEVVDSEAGQPLRFVAAPFAQEQRAVAPPSQILAQRRSGFGVQVDRPGPAVTNIEPQAWWTALDV